MLRVMRLEIRYTIRLSLLLLAISTDFLGISSSSGPLRLFLGYLSIGLSICTSLPLIGRATSWDSQNAKPPFITSQRDMNLTLLAGGVLAIFTAFVCLLSNTSLSSSLTIFSFLSVASMAALVFFAKLPSSLTSRNIGVAASCAVMAGCSLLLGGSTWTLPAANVALCGLAYGAIFCDIKGVLHSKHHHKHHHDHEDPFHGTHSRLTAFLLTKCRPGSITHSILLEKDSRRIAYFGW